MSKVYDEYMECAKENFNKSLPASYALSMLPKNDEKLNREIRDKAIMNLIVYALENNITLTYGDIVYLIDGDKNELEYEEMKKGLKK